MGQMKAVLGTEVTSTPRREVGIDYVPHHQYKYVNA